MDKKKGAFRTSIGGQALIEGILMRGPEKDAIVVRYPEGLVTKVQGRLRHHEAAGARQLHHRLSLPYIAFILRSACA